MASKSKKDNLVRMVSEAGTGTFIVRKKNPRKTEKMKMRKYDPVTRKHEDFVEKKLPSPKSK